MKAVERTRCDYANKDWLMSELIDKGNKLIDKQQEEEKTKRLKRALEVYEPLFICNKITVKPYVLNNKLTK